MITPGGMNMNLQWFNEQVVELNMVLSKQTRAVEIPDVVPVDYQPELDSDLAVYIDHTLLKPEVGEEQIRQELEQARPYNFATVCIHPRYVSLAAEILADSSIKVCTVVGFPLGQNTTLSKVFEARDALAHGAEELDMVLPIGALKTGDYYAVYQDVAAVKEAAGSRVLKVILETPYLTDAEIVKGSLLVKAAGADFVKTATGFAGGGATTKAVSLMRQAVGLECGVKAAGGVRSADSALTFLRAGANRIGTSSGIAIVNLSEGDPNGY